MRILITKTLQYILGYRLGLSVLLLLCACTSNGNPNSDDCCAPFKFQTIQKALIEYVESQDDGLKDCKFKVVKESDVLEVVVEDNKNVISHFKSHLIEADFGDLDLNEFKSYTMATRDLCSMSKVQMFFLFIVVEGEIHFISHYSIS